MTPETLRKRLELYGRLDTVKMDVSDISPMEAAESIARLIKAED